MNLLVGVALVLGLMIMIHEWGHFIVARIFGVRVDVFSIGFGPRLFGWKRGPPTGASAPSVRRLCAHGRTRHYRCGCRRKAAHRFLRRINEQAPLAARPDFVCRSRGKFDFPGFGLGGFVHRCGRAAFRAYLDQPVQVVALTFQAGSAEPLSPATKFSSSMARENPTWETSCKSCSAILGAGAEAQRRSRKQRREAARSKPLCLIPPAIRLLGYPPLQPVLDEVAPGSPADPRWLQRKRPDPSVDGQKTQYWGQFVERVRGSEGKPVKLECAAQGPDRATRK